MNCSRVPEVVYMLAIAWKMPRFAATIDSLCDSVNDAASNGVGPLRWAFHVSNPTSLDLKLISEKRGEVRGRTQQDRATRRHTPRSRSKASRQDGTPPQHHSSIRPKACFPYEHQSISMQASMILVPISSIRITMKRV